MARFALVAAMLVFLQIQTASASSPIKEDYRDVSQYVSANASGRDVVVASTPFTVYPIEYYYTGQASLVTLPLWNRLQFGAIPTYTTSTLVQNLGSFNGYEKLWLILSYDHGYQESMRIYMDTHYERLETREFSPGIALYVYRIRYDNATLSDARSIIRTLSLQQSNP